MVLEGVTDSSICGQQGDTIKHHCKNSMCSAALAKLCRHDALDNP